MVICFFFLSVFCEHTHDTVNIYDQIHQTVIHLTTVVGHERRYKILCANAVQEPCEPQKATQIILDAINLESDQYRMGHTKVSDTCCGPRCDNSVMTLTLLQTYGQHERRKDAHRMYRISCGCLLDARLI